MNGGNHRIWGMLVILILLGFALPALTGAVESLIIPAIVIMILAGIGSIVFYRRRRW